MATPSAERALSSTSTLSSVKVKSSKSRSGSSITSMLFASKVSYSLSTKSTSKFISSKASLISCVVTFWFFLPFSNNVAITFFLSDIFLLSPCFVQYFLSSCSPAAPLLVRVAFRKSFRFSFVIFCASSARYTWPVLRVFFPPPVCFAEVPPANALNTCAHPPPKWPLGHCAPKSLPFY